MLIKVKLFRRSSVVLARLSFLIRLSFEKDRSHLQLVTIMDKNMRRAISMFGKDDSRRFDLILEYKQLSLSETIVESQTMFSCGLQY